MPAVEFHRDVPGYAEAVRREEEIRTVPFLGIPEHIAGIPMDPLTLRKLQWLTMVNSPFLMKLEPDGLIDKPGIAADLIVFVWICSDAFKPGDDRAKKRFLKKNRRIMNLPAKQVIQEILDYVAEAFMDSGNEDKLSGDQRSYYATAASFADFFHKNYGLEMDLWENRWPRRLMRLLTGRPNVMDIPLKVAFQLIRVHQKNKMPEITLTNRLSSPKIDEWLNTLNKQN